MRKRNEPGIFPGRHMNKAHWLTVALEPTCESEVTYNDDGTIVIKLDHNGLWVKYEFTEE